MKKYLKKLSSFSRSNRLVFYVFILIALTPIAIFLTNNPHKVHADSFLKFDEGGGSTTTDAQNNTTGTITNAHWKEESFCVAGKCLFFDGSGDYISFGDDADFDFAGATNWTIEFWFRHGPATTQEAFVSKTFGTAGYLINLEPTGNIAFSIDDDATWAPLPDDFAISTAGNYDDNVWHHVAAVKTGTSKIELFIDGQLVGSDTSLTATGSLVNSTNLTIGMLSDGSSYPYTGFIDEVKIYTTTAKDATTIKSDVIKGSGESGSSVVFGHSEPLSNGLIGYWKMDESSWTNNCSTATALDSSGGDYNLTSCPNTTGPTGGASGKYGRGGTFDGSNDYLESSNTIFNLADNITLSAWVKPAGAPSGDVYVIDRSNNNGGYSLGWNSSLYPRLRVGNGTSTIQTTFSTAMTIGTWYHLTATVDATGKASLYVNGTLEAVGATSILATTSGQNLRIGSRSAANTINGTIDEIRIYSRALSSNEVSLLYNQAPGPIGHWRLDENTGSSVMDSSTNGFTGTWIGTADQYWTTGKISSAGNFNGSNNRINIGDISSQLNLISANPQSFTIEAWFKKPTATGGGDLGGITLLNYDVRLLYRTNGTIIFQMIPGENYPSAVVTANQWVHAAGVYDNVNNLLKLYIDGVLVDSVTPDSHDLSGSTTDMVIGYSQNYYKGYIDDVKVYNYERTPEQILQDMNSGSSLDSPIAYWKFDEGSGTIANDRSTNSLNLTLSTSSWTNNGKFNNAWNGDGAIWASIADASTANKLDFAASEDFAISLWLRSDSATNPSATEYLLSKAEASAGYRIYVENDSSGTVSFGIDDDTSWTPGDKVSTTTDIYDATWHHLAAVKTGTTKIQMYLDGKLVGEDTAIAESGTLENAATLYIGDRNGANGGDEFFGDIDEVKIFRQALNSTQVLQLYQGGFSTTMGSTSTDSQGNASNASQREYCPPGNTEANCGSGDPSPVGHWKLDENTGTITNDSSTSNNNSNSFSGQTTWTTGKNGTGLTFDGIGDYVSVTDPGASSMLDMSDSFTVSHWVNLASIPTDEAFFVTKGDSVDNNYWTEYSNTDDVFYCGVWDGATANTVEYSIIPTLNTWYHIECVFDDANNNLKLYLNGRLVGENASATLDPNNAVNNGELRFGRERDTYDYYLHGKIDDIKIYNYARTPAQIAWDFNKGAPIAWYKFDECSGDTAYNSALNSAGKAAGMNAAITIGASGTYTSTGSCSSGIATHAWNAGASGKYGSAFAVDATNDYASISDTTNLDFTTSMTVAGWIYSDTLPSTSLKDAHIVNKFLTATNQRSFKLIVDKTDNKYYFLVDGDGTSGATVSVASDVLFTTGSWHHVVGVFQNSTGYLYVDGKLQSNTSTQGFTSVFNSTADIVIGMDANKTSAPNAGKYDDIMLFNYPLTQNQITTLFNQGSAIRL